MRSENNPLPAALRGNSPAQVALRLFLATRPIFFSVSILSVLLGTAWGVRESASLDLAAFALAMAATLCVHAAVNVINDVYDDIYGGDPINEDRMYPYTGGSRFIQSGLMERRDMLHLGLFLLAVAALLGGVLASLKGVAVVGFGLAGMALGVLYSVGPVLLAGRGVGELAVGVGFGALPVSGAAWLQCGVVDWRVLLISLPLSCWVFNVLLMNEIPDAGADREVGKRTLVVRLGLTGTCSVYLAVNVLAFMGLCVALLQGLFPAIVLAVPTVLLLAAVYMFRVLKADMARRGMVATAIKTTLAIHAVGAVWLIAFAARW